MIRKIRNIVFQKIGLYHFDKKIQAMSYMFPAMINWNKNDGDYLEFGVFRGRAFIAAYNEALKKRFTQMKFFAFDSFEGLPSITGNDANHKHFYKGQYACSKEEFIDILKNANIDLNRVEIVPGFFDQSLTDKKRDKLNIKRVAIAWIDCDIYESTVPVLEFLTPIIDTGTFMVFDDWHSFAGDPKAGQIKAVREWLEDNRNITLEYYRDFGTSGRIFLVQKWD